MAERRMFAKTIVLSDAFLDMPPTARCLYFTLSMLADDDGFVNSPRSVMRQTGATDDDMKILIAKKFVLLFDDGVIVIKHWRINNYLRNDRYVPTVYKEDFAKLSVDEKKAYKMTEDSGIPNIGIPNNGIPSTVQDSTGKVSIDQDSTGTVQGEPSIEEIRQYAQEIQSKTDPERFYSYYAGRWNTVRDWRALFRSWSKSDQERTAPQRKGNYFAPHAPEPVVETGETDFTDEEGEELMAMFRGGT